jgi:hypothetical protein
LPGLFEAIGEAVFRILTESPEAAFTGAVGVSEFDLVTVGSGSVGDFFPSFRDFDLNLLFSFFIKREGDASMIIRPGWNGPAD